MVHLNGSGCPVWHSWMPLGTQYGMARQAGLVTQYGTAGWSWAPSVAWPDKTGDGLGTQFGTAGRVTLATVSVATSAPRTEARHSQWGHECMGTRMTQGCHIQGPGCSQGCHVPGLGCYIPSRMGLSSRVSHPSTRVSSGMFHPRANTSQGCHIPGVSHPILGCPQEHPAGTGLSGWGPWR